MSQRRYQKVQSRSQMSLFPSCLNDYVSEDNPVFAIDAFVGTLDLQDLRFEHTEAKSGTVQSGAIAESVSLRLSGEDTKFTPA